MRSQSVIACQPQAAHGINWKHLTKISEPTSSGPALEFEAFMKLSTPVLALALLAQSNDSQWVERLAFWQRGQLRSTTQRIAAIDDQLHSLPEFTQINSSGSIGFKTAFLPDDEDLWVEVTLPQPRRVDTVVLVPPLAKGANGVVSGYGFPTRFKIEAFDEKESPRLVFDATQQDYPSPGGYPVIVSFTPLETRRVRFTATEPWQRDGASVLALAEMMILSGERNVAPDGLVTSSRSRDYPISWSRRNLIDMITPLGLPVLPGSPGKLGFHSAVASRPDEAKSVTLTLPETVPLDEVWLVPVRRREIPLWFDYGFPERCRIESATQPDFSDAHLIYETKAKTPPVYGMNLVRFASDHTTARYVRITATQLWKRHDDFVFALAEVQAISNGKNVALGASATASDVLADDPAHIWGLDALTDGRTNEGTLLPLSEWFALLDKRRVLEQERAGLIATRTTLIEKAQQTLVYTSVTSVIVITVLSATLLWRQQRERRRDAQRLQEKLARDLHDEIGSNLGSITLICSIAAQPDATPESMRADFADIERVAAESADSMRDMVQLISPRRTDDAGSWLTVLQGLAERLLRNHALDCQLPTAPLSTEPGAETRRELYLFCKEVLHNIARHAHATRVRFHLSPASDGLQIVISDNGVGFDTAQPSTGHGLGNLRERAAMMKATLRLDSQPGAGTTITLHVPRTHRWRTV